MKVFITGATGYVGSHVALALSRAGHEVFGLVRSEEKAKGLAKQEVTPVMGNLQEPESYIPVAEQCSALIHAAVDGHGDKVGLEKKTVESLLRAAKHGPQPKKFLYTSGVWIYGNTAERLVDETTPVAPPTFVVWRPGVEQMVLKASHVKSLVLRPGCVYGKQAGLTGHWFTGAYKEKALRVVGDGNNRWAMIHADDLAEGYLRAVESGYSGEVFNFTDRSRATIREMASAAGRAAGYTGQIEFVPVSEAAKAMGADAECLALDQHVDSRKAVNLLGWQPRHGGFVDAAHALFAAWKAHS